MFIEKLDYLAYYSKQDTRIQRVLIGRNVWFLNYVSFSYDSRYVAFGAKLRSDEFRHSEEGIFEIYDLEKKNVICRMDKEKQIHAVWMTLFSRLGDVAFYDSHSNVYIIKASSNYKSVEKIYWKKFTMLQPIRKTYCIFRSTLYKL